jgi:hypothetical protein
MTKTIILLAAIVAGTNAVVQPFENPKAKVTVRVVDENNRPMENAKVSLGYGDTADEGLTDMRGLFTSEGRCGITGIGASIKKDGYYLGAPLIPRFTEHDEVLNHWKPWNETYTATLRPIGKPVTLYAKTVQLQLPALDEPCGFDLEASDWVAPYGKGMKMDFIFTVHEKWNGNYDFDLQGELTFKNPLDGLQEVAIPDIAKNSVFRWERLAPENSYEPKQELRDAWFPHGSGKKPVRSYKSPDVWQGYFFRVRTVEQGGQIVSAHYGKIRGGIVVYPDSQSGKPKISLTYYFNPTPNDRNLEWDTKKNLFGGLTDMETPREP